MIRSRPTSTSPSVNESTKCFVDYLNFFEYVSSLRKAGQLTQDEILMLFDYYLRLIRKHDSVWTFVCEHSFENLAKLVEELPPRVKKG
jgi:hypothetical protein